jgi:hypothetical protein
MQINTSRDEESQTTHQPRREQRSQDVRRAAPIKVSRVRGPSLHGVPTVIMPNMLDDAHRHEVPAWTHHNRTRRVWVL